MPKLISKRYKKYYDGAQFTLYNIKIFRCGKNPNSMLCLI